MLPVGGITGRQPTSGGIVTSPIESRNEAIRQLYREGLVLREKASELTYEALGLRFGLSGERIRQIVGEKVS